MRHLPCPLAEGKNRWKERKTEKRRHGVALPAIWRGSFTSCSQGGTLGIPVERAIKGESTRFFFLFFFFFSSSLSLSLSLSLFSPLLRRGQRFP